MSTPDMEYPERWNRHRAKRRPDLEVCLECGTEVAVDDLPNSWEGVTADDGLTAVGFVCVFHGEAARRLGYSTN